MLAYIKANYKAGDTIEVTSSQGVFTGAIEYVTDQYIILRQPNGQVCGIAASDILTFRAECPVALVPQQQPATQAPADENEDEQADDADSQSESADIAPTVPILEQPKVVGHIDLASIDPKLGKRKYFKPTSESVNQSEYGDAQQPASRPTYGSRQPYVSARGRITYYNNDKRYGFIHDYNSDNDLYFNLNQVADYDLYNHLHKGTKVAYTMDRNAQGFTARCVHLPNTVSNLLEMANDYFDSRHYNLAQGLVEHVLEVDADNKEAKSLLDEIRNSVPNARFAQGGVGGAGQYNPCAIYSQAKKAYLAKDYAQAEELYKKAMEAGEKPESCVKDLVTLYVSLFKQAADEDEKEAARNKAIDFLESHRDMLPDNLTTKQFLALNYYLPILDYNHFIETVDEILADPQVTNVLSRRVFYIWQKGIALNKLGRRDEALKLIEEGLTLAPRSRQLISLRNLIIHPEYENFASSATPVAEEDMPATGNDAEEEPETADAPQSEVPEAAAEEGEAKDEADETATENKEDKEEESDETTGSAKPDSWWDDLRNRF